MAKAKNSKRKWLKIILVAFLIIVAGTAFIGWDYYKKIFHSNISLKEKSTYLYIPTGSDFNDVLNLLTEGGYIINTASFEWVAEMKKYKNNVKPGRYRIKNGMSNNEIVNLLRSGMQEPVKVIIHNVRKPEEMAGRVSSFIEADSLSIIEMYRDPEIRKKYGFSGEKMFCLFIPNTYEFYWNTSAEDFFERMAKEYKLFWTEERQDKAAQLNLSQSEVAIIASIVEKESVKRDEYSAIAGVYLNRIRKGMKLQADPTVVFAIGDFTKNRVMRKDLEYDSPYNTYLYEGIPPGPICLPGTIAIDAVLNAERHNYIYFCAREDFSGYHNFARTLEQHEVNAKKYRRALDKLNIKK